MATAKNRALIALPTSTIAKLEEFRAREWKYIPQETRRSDVSYNQIILRLLDLELHTRADPARTEKRQQRSL